MSARQEAIALITAAEDPLLQIGLWLGREASALEIVTELSCMARAAIRTYAEDNEVEASDIMQMIGLREAGQT